MTDTDSKLVERLRHIASNEEYLEDEQTLLAAADRLAQLERERDEARSLYAKNRAFLDGKIAEFDAAEAERDSLAAKLKVAEEAVSKLDELIDSEFVTDSWVKERALEIRALSAIKQPTRGGE